MAVPPVPPATLEHVLLDPQARRELESPGKPLASLTEIRSRRSFRTADESFIASFRKLAQHVPEGETHEVGSIFAFVTGLPLSGFNGCVVTQKASAADLAGLAGVGGCTRRSLSRVGGTELAAGLTEVPSSYALEPATSLSPGDGSASDTRSRRIEPGVSVVSSIESSLDEFICVLVESGLRPELAVRLITPSLAADPDVQLFVGRLDGKPVGTSIAIRSPDASGIYNVGTLPRARRRGVGSAVTWAAIEAGRAWGYDTVVLQSSAMGLSMYSAMGFRTVAPYVVFANSAAD